MNQLRIFPISGLILFLLFGTTVLVSGTHSDTTDDLLVWTTNSLTKVKPHDPPDKLSPISISAARNEYESFQVIVTAGGNDLSDVDVTVSNLISSNGAISRKNIHIYKVAYINVREPSNIQGATGEWPDALIPKVDDYVKERRNAFPFSVAAGRNQPVWIEIYVPASAVEGDYTGKVLIKAKDHPTQTVDFKLTVWNFSLPETSSLKTAFAVGIPDNIATGHYGNSNISQADKLALLKIYTLAELKHRLSNDACVYPSLAYNGHSIDWTSFDKQWGPFLDGKVLPTGARLTSIRMDEQNSNFEDQFYQLYVEHFKERGWFDRLFHYTADEPTSDRFEFIKNRAEQLHRIDPKLRVLVTTEYTEDLKGAVNIWAPVINYVEDKEGLGRAAEDHRSIYDNTISEGNELWWYQSCFSHGCNISVTGDSRVDNYFTGWPSYMIDLPAVFSRIMEWLTWRYQVGGELYYLTTYAYSHGDPWTDQFYFGGNGDGTLFYPGTPEKIGGHTHIPIESIRLKMIRDGLEDYEYFKLLADKGMKDFVDNQVESVAPKTYSWSQDPAQLLSARAALGAELSRISK